MVVVLVALVVCAAVFALAQQASGPTEGDDPMVLANEVCARARALGFDAEVGGGNHILIHGTSLGETRLNLANLAAEIRLSDTEEERVEVIDRHLRSLLPSDKRRMVVLVRSSEYLEELAEADLNRNQIKPIAGDLYAIVAWDEGERISTRTISDEELGEDPIAAGLEGVKALSNEIEMRGDDLKMITCGGDYEASLLLDDIWDFVSEHVDGDVIAAVPARDLLVVTGANNAAGLTKMEAFIQRVFDEDFPYPVSRTMLRRKDGAWVVERVVK